MSTTLRWYRSRDIGAGEIIIVPLLIIGAIALHRLTPEQVRAIPTYQRMNSIIPLIWWELAAIVCAALIIAGVIFVRRIAQSVGFLGSAIFWMTIGLIIWRASHTYLTPALYVAFALGSAKRAGELIAVRGG